jgi:hypothetical protein
MIKILAILLLVLWLTGMLLFKTLGAIIHLCLVLGIILLLVGVIRGRRST